MPSPTEAGGAQRAALPRRPAAVRPGACPGRGRRVLAGCPLLLRAPLGDLMKLSSGPKCYSHISG